MGVWYGAIFGVDGRVWYGGGRRRHPGRVPGPERWQLAELGGGGAGERNVRNNGAGGGRRCVFGLCELPAANVAGVLVAIAYCPCPMGRLCHCEGREGVGGVGGVFVGTRRLLKKGFGVRGAVPTVLHVDGGRSVHSVATVDARGNTDSVWIGQSRIPETDPKGQFQDKHHATMRGTHVPFESSPIPVLVPCSPEMQPPCCTLSQELKKSYYGQVMCPI